jgi:hypothetical protein
MQAEILAPATSISKPQLRIDTLADMASLMSPHILRNRNVRPSEPDYPTIARPLRFVSDYARLRQWQILRNAGFKSRRDLYEQALEHIGQDWALSSMGPLRIAIIEGKIPQPLNSEFAFYFNGSAQKRIQDGKAILEERSAHIVTVLKDVSEIYKLYPLKRGEKPNTTPSPAAAYEMAKLPRGRESSNLF